MFKKIRERVEKLENTHDSVHRAMNHFLQYRETYIAAAGCAAGLTVGHFLRRTNGVTVVNNICAGANHISPVESDLLVTTDQLALMLMHPEVTVDFYIPELGKFVLHRVD